MKVLDAKTWFTILPLAEGLFGICEFGHFEEVISFLSVGKEDALLIDSGLGLFSMKDEVQKITSLPCNVLNTHSHFDHVGSNFEFANVELLDHPTNRRIAQEGYSSQFLASWCTDDQFWNNPPRNSQNPYVISPFQHASFFKNGDSKSYGSLSLTVIHTPGHSDDSACFFDPVRGWLFAGDLLYEGPIYIEKNGGLAKYKKSIEIILSLRNIKRIFCSHNSCELALERVVEIRNALMKIATSEIKEEITLGGCLKLIPC